MPKGGTRINHKYIKRTGGPGNYRYWYKDDQGNMYSSTTPVGGKEGAKTTSDVLKVKHKDGGKPIKYVTAKVKENKIFVTKKVGMPYVDHVWSTHDKRMKQMEIPNEHNPKLKASGDLVNSDHDVYYAIRYRGIVGHIGLTTSDESNGAPVINSLKVDKEHEGQEVEEELLKEVFKKNPLVFSKSLNEIDNKQGRAWLALKKKYPNHIKFDWDKNRFSYDQFAEKPKTSVEIHGEYSLDPQSVKDYNKHLADISNEVYNSFLNNDEDFEQIDEGICGKKGLVSIGNNKYFIKSEQGGDMKVQRSAIHETAYTDIIHSVFLELKEHFPAKLKVGQGAFIQDSIDMSHRHDLNEVVNAMDPERVAKLAAVNYILGNKDRHGGNLFASQDGSLSLFDEGLAFHVPGRDELGGKDMPSYMERLHPSNIMDTNEMRNFFSEENINKAKAIAKSHGIDDAELGALEDRFNNFKYHLNASEKLDSVPTKAFFEQLTAAKIPLGEAAIETKKSDNE